MINNDFISIMPVIAEVLSQFKRLNASGILSEDDCYNYAVSFLKLIGYNIYQSRTEFIAITNYRYGGLPKSLYRFENVKYCVSSGTHHTVKLQDIKLETQHKYFKGMVPMRPSDNLTLDYCQNAPIDDTDNAYTIGFTYKYRTNLFICEKKDGIVRVTYNYLGTDENGDFVVVNEENCIKAMKNYILLESLKEEYVMGKMARYIYKDIEAEYESYKRDAISEMSALGPDEIDSLIAKDRMRMNRFKL